MEGHRSHRAIVFFESVDQRAHAVIPQLNCAGVERDQEPWSCRVESKALRSRGLAFELNNQASVRDSVHEKGGGAAGVTFVSIVGEDILGRAGAAKQLALQASREEFGSKTPHKHQAG
jgi:hypothetical protein